MGSQEFEKKERKIYFLILIATAHEIVKILFILNGPVGENKITKQIATPHPLKKNLTLLSD